MPSDAAIRRLEYVLSKKKYRGKRVQKATAYKKMKSRKFNKRNRISIPRQSHTFTERVIEEDNLVVNGAGFFKTFSLDQIYNSTAYQKLFEYYKLNKVIVTLRYKAAMNPHQDNVTATTQSVNETNPVIWFKVDHNDITTQTLPEMKASTRTKEIQFTNNRPKIEIVLKPAVITEAYKSTVQSTYIPKWGQYLTTGDPTVPHYGLKMYATGSAAPGTPSYGSIIVTKQLYFTCKNNE